MKYILTFLSKFILYFFKIVVVYGIFWLLCILWYFELNPPFPKDARYTYDPEDWRFTHDFKYAISRMKI